MPFISTKFLLKQNSKNLRYDPGMTFLKTFYELLMKFLQTSYEPLMNIL